MITFAHQILTGKKHARSAADILDTTLGLDLRQGAVVDNLHFARAQALRAVAVLQATIEGKRADQDEVVFEKRVEQISEALAQALVIYSVRTGSES